MACDDMLHAHFGTTNDFAKSAPIARFLSPFATVSSCITSSRLKPIAQISLTTFSSCNTPLVLSWWPDSNSFRGVTTELVAWEVEASDVDDPKAPSVLQ